MFSNVDTDITRELCLLTHDEVERKAFLRYVENTPFSSKTTIEEKLAAFRLCMPVTQIELSKNYRETKKNNAERELKRQCYQRKKFARESRNHKAIKENEIQIEKGRIKPKYDIYPCSYIRVAFIVN